MLNLYEAKDEELMITTREIRNTMQKRGWPKVMKMYAGGQSQILAMRPDGKEVRIFSSTPPTTSAFSFMVAEDKMAMYELLKEYRVRQPETRFVNAPGLEEFIAKYGRIAVKPHNGAHGRQVYLDVKDAETARQIADKIEKNSTNGARAIAQMQVEGSENEIRVICIDYKFVMAFERIPAAVTGDGEHTVAELIKIENDTIRGEPNMSKLAKINYDEALAYLGNKAGMVPAVGEKVRVHQTCNMGNGGTARVASKEVLGRRGELAEVIAKICRLPVIGVDFFEDYVIEVNATPGLQMTTGNEAEELYCVEEYVKYLERMDI